MDNLDDSENNAKISDSAYSNSCSNSQSRRSRSSKSTHSGSNSSGSSGYGGGKPSATGYSPKSSGLVQISEKRVKDKDAKKKKTTQVQDPTKTECDAPPCTSQMNTIFEAPIEDNVNVSQTSEAEGVNSGPEVESMDISTCDKNSNKDVQMSTYINTCNVQPGVNQVNCVASRPTPTSGSADGFSCVISMHDGVVMYTTSSLTTSLGFPKDMWIGRSFIDFVHPRDRVTFASQITNGLAVPKNANGTQKKATNGNDNSVSSMVCRIRRYRGLSTGFGVKELVLTFMPFLLKLSFKNINDEEGNVIYLVIQASPFFSAFKTPNEPVMKASPFVIRHSANGNLEYIDPESVPYLGYLPQDVTDTDALLLYHHEDLPYLRQVYKTIVKEGGMPRCKSYRMMAQNGDYIKVETEWLSFINPWSRKLEFIIGKHYIIEGPSNPDVFQTPDPDKEIKQSEEEKNIAQNLREHIVRIMNLVLTKPAEVAKQQMTKRCQDLASFMESLMEEPAKNDDELRLDIHDADHSYYERDSVMLGGISPHHEYNDSKSSTETPLSYNQLNYNETLHRYFDSHQPYSDDSTATQKDNTVAMNDTMSSGQSNWLSPMAQHLTGSVPSWDITSSSESNTLAVSGGSQIAQMGDYKPIRLTETLINKHNLEMEKELLKKHREIRSSTKGEREKATNETYQKKRDHLARCNASFQPTSAGLPLKPEPQSSHGLKRSLKQPEPEAGAYKHHCSRQSKKLPTGLPATSVNNTVAPWGSNAVTNMNAFIFGVGLPQQMSIMSPAPPVTGMFPMYYAPAHGPAAIATPLEPSTSTADPTKMNQSFQPPMQCMIYGQAVYGQPFMYSPMTHPMAYNMQQSVASSSAQFGNINTLGLASSNYEEVCKISLPVKTSKQPGNLWRDRKLQDSQRASTKTDQGADSSSSNNALQRSKEAVPDQIGPKPVRSGNRTDEPVDKTDGESSYSSFYSSFFKTESGSAEDSGDAKKAGSKNSNQNKQGFGYQYPVKKVARRKMEPPWLEQVCVTPKLIYKYQIMTRSMDEVLSGDKLKIESIEQPSLVNEQLDQLYLDLQLEGVASRLTLEEGITSSSSSGEETTSKSSKGPRRKREYSKLVMIYEEDAPLPPPFEAEAPTPGTSTS